MHVHAIWPTFPDLAGYSYLAVDFFFMLSGFVMARTYEARLVAGFGVCRFLRARAVRLWPTLAVGAVLALPFAWRDHPHVDTFLMIVIPNLLLLPSLAAPQIFGLNMPAWSVFFELVANAAHAWVLCRLRMATLAVIAVAAFGILATLGWHYGHLDLGSRLDNAIGGLARVALAYVAGIVLWRRFGDRAPVPVPPLLAWLAMPAVFSLARWLGDDFRLDLAFVVLGCPLLLWGGLRQRRFARISSLAGALSFPLYAVHYPVLLVADAYGLSGWAGLIVAVVAGAIVTRALAPRKKPRALHTNYIPAH